MSSSSDPSTLQLPTLVLYTKANCPLCDEVKHLIKPHLNRVDYGEVDIKAPGNESIFGQYRFEIPVIRIQNRANKNIVLKNKQITAHLLHHILEEK